MYDLIILGGGPAGVAAGIYVARKKIKTLLITREFGGQSLSSGKIENWIGVKSISGLDFAKSLEEHLRAHPDVEIVSGASVKGVSKIDGGFAVEDFSGKIWESRTLLIAAGSSPRKLNVSGEEKFSGKGVFYCATCDAPIMKDKEVVIVGGGNSGLEAAVDLLFYASKIYVLEYSNELKGDAVYQEKLKMENKVEIITNAQILEIFGDDFVSGIKYKNISSGEEKNLNVSGVFVEIGFVPNSGIVKSLVELDERGQIIVDHKTFRTSCDGIWASGDITDGHYKQINTSIGEGVSAALNVDEYLKNNL